MTETATAYAAYELELVGLGDVTRLMFGGDLAAQLDRENLRWDMWSDSGVGFGERDMQWGFTSEENARDAYSKAAQVMEDSGMKHSLALYGLRVVTDGQQQHHERVATLLGSGR